MFWDQTLVELFYKGGLCMWPLLACSVIGVAIMVDRAVYFFRLRFNYEKFLSELKKLLAAKQVKEAALRCRTHPNPIPKMAGEYLKNLGNDDIRDEVLKREGSLALEKVEQRLRGLATLTHIAPLLGLLGTVTGLVTAFHKIELLKGQVVASDLASGIWEALITTVFGLVIAIPCMATFHYFESKADTIARRMQFVVSELDEFFGKHSHGSFKSQAAATTDDEMKAVS